MANDQTTAANWAIARARWEGEPRCSYADLTDFLGISKQAIGKRAVKEGWTKKINMRKIVETAHAVADQRIARDAALPSDGAGLVDDSANLTTWVAADSPAAAVIPVPVPDSRHATPEMLAQAVENAAVDARAQILKRHRSEWVAARNQIYKALKSGDNAQAKLAKLAGETLKLIQDGERKAWGLDSGETEAGQVRIVIERQEGVRVVR